MFDVRERKMCGFSQRAFGEFNIELCLLVYYAMCVLLVIFIVTIYNYFIPTQQLLLQQKCL